MAEVEEPAEMLATRRSRRSTAGNRMEAALAEIASEDAMRDLDDDKEFFVENDEQDEFGSDFESTDEEAEKIATVGGDTEVAEEERRVKKAARSKLERMTAAAHAKHKDTFNPDLQLKDKEGPSRLRTKPKTRGNVKLGNVIDAETGEVVVARDPPVSQGRKRVSKRKHTVMNTSATTTRLKQNEQKKASVPKKHKTEHKVWSQAELLAQALDTEEGNITEHRDYLKNEAEKRKRARVTRTKVEGPLIRWKSRLEEITVVLPPPPPPPPAPAPVAAAVPPSTIAAVPSFAPTITTVPNLAAYRGVYGGYGGTFTPTTYTFTTGANGVTASTASTSASATFIAQSGTRQPFTQFQHYQPPNATTTSPFPMWPPPVSTSQNHQPYYSVTTSVPALPATPANTTPTMSTAATMSVTSAQTAAPTNPQTITAAPAVATAPMTVSPPSTAGAIPQVAAAPEPAASSPTPTLVPPTPTSVSPSPSTSAIQPAPTSAPTLTPTSPAEGIDSTTPLATTAVAVSETPIASAPTPVIPVASEVASSSIPADDKPKEPETTKETVTKNYVIHELVQQKSGPKPSWTSTMGAMFGDHVKWDEIKVYSGKNRPLSRPRQTCPITGQQARYFDPRTGVPYANSRAYKTLTQLIKHEYVWDPSLGCYTNCRPIDQQPPAASTSSASP